VKKRLLSVFVVGLLAVTSLGASPSGAVERTARAQVPSFDNCRQLRKQWVYGVAKSGAAVQRQLNSGHYPPRVFRPGYAANDHLDADNDGTACEVLTYSRPTPEALGFDAGRCVSSRRTVRTARRAPSPNSSSTARRTARFGRCSSACCERRAAPRAAARGPYLGRSRQK